MTDVTASDTAQAAPSGAVATPTSAAPAGPDAAQLAALAADLETRLTAQSALAAQLQTERDALAGERDRIAADLDKLTRQAREAAVLDRVAASAPAKRTELATYIAGLAAQGRVDLHTDTADKTAAAIVGIMKSEQSAFLRAPVGASGGTTPTIQVTQTAARRFLI